MTNTRTELGRGLAGRVAGRVAWSLGLLAAGGCMAQTVLTFDVDSGASQTTWGAGQQDITIRLRLSNTGPAISSISGVNFYVVVNGGDGPTTPKVYNATLVGITGSVVPVTWVQSPAAGSAVASADTSALIVSVDDGGNNGSVGFTIPAPDVGQTANVTPFADITLRRQLTQIGTWALQFYIPDSTPGGTSHTPSSFVQDLGGGNVGEVSVGNFSIQVTAVPEPSTYAAAAGGALLAFGMIRRRGFLAGR